MATLKHVTWTQRRIGVIVVVVLLVGALLGTWALLDPRDSQQQNASAKAASAPAPAPSPVSTPASAPPPFRATIHNTGARGPMRTVGSRTVTRDGAVVRNLRIRGQLTIEADDVLVENVHVYSGASYGILVRGKRATIQWTTIQGTPGATLAGLAADEVGSFRAIRIRVMDVEDGVRLSNLCVLRRSFIYRLAGHSGSHYDGVTADGYRGWRIMGNRILNRHAQTSAVWIGDPRYAPSAGLLQNNILAGGGYTLYAGPSTGLGLRVIGNRFSTAGFPRAGRWGPVTAWSAAGNEWRDNTWLGGPRDGREVQP
ncbi:hypothetical protein [Nocardioides insulae]|uniref:hypothetical protein n=1 Tax=Nocardioides insulae TaxID=394734 RepID=UPI0004130047|nr:hypothetical protein [Nocardioides insulae]